MTKEPWSIGMLGHTSEAHPVLEGSNRPQTQASTESLARLALMAPSNDPFAFCAVGEPQWSISAEHRHSEWAALSESVFATVTQPKEPAGFFAGGGSLQEQIIEQLRRAGYAGTTLMIAPGYEAAFGHLLARVEEVRQRVEKMESMLATALGQLVAPNRTMVVPVESLAPEPYDILRPFPLIIRPSGDGFSAAFLEANLHAYGDTEEEAVTNLKGVVLDAHDRLSELTASELGPAMAEQKRVLALHVRKQGG